MFTVLAAVAQIERELIRDRVREGMVNARLLGAAPKGEDSADGPG